MPRRQSVDAPSYTTIASTPSLSRRAMFRCRHCPVVPLVAMLLVPFAACSPGPASKEAPPSTTDDREAEGRKMAYDSLKAAALGADDYGMHRYVMALLKRGPNRTLDSTEAARLQAAHLSNIQRLGREGTLILAGPFLDDGSLRGIYVFDVPTVEQARALTESDPAIQAGSLVMELHPWYGPAMMKELYNINERVTKKTF